MMLATAEMMMLVMIVVIVVILMVLRIEIHVCVLPITEWARRTLFGLILWLAGGWLGKLGGWAAEKDGLAMLTLIIYQSDFLSQKWTWPDKIFSPKGRSINFKSFKDGCDCPAKALGQQVWAQLTHLIYFLPVFLAGKYRVFLCMYQ